MNISENVKVISKLEATQKEYYPTPEPLAKKMLEGLDLTEIKTVLEPSAGAGDLVYGFGKAYQEAWWDSYKAHGWANYYGGKTVQVDCVEIDPNFRAILKNRFSDDRARELLEQERNATDEAGRKVIAERRRIVENIDLHVVGSDFLNFFTANRYDLILMNPPFSNGAAHLMQAISMQERYGGEIRCLLNAETLRNPYTLLRKDLVKKLDKLGAEITYESGAFSNAERKTDVEIAIVRISIPAVQWESDFFRSAKAAEDKYRAIHTEPTDMVVGDQIQALVSMYRTEVNAGIRLITEYLAMAPYLLHSLKADKYSQPILSLSVYDSKLDWKKPFDPREYVKAVRLKYWRGLFQRDDFMSQLTSELANQYRGRVDEFAEYEFDVDNIRLLYADMSVQVIESIDQSVFALFDKLSEKHSWYPESQKNIHYYNGWASNKAHKVNTKVIIPTHAAIRSYCYDWFDNYGAYNFLSDIEKALNYLDGNRTAEIDLRRVLDLAYRSGQTKNIACKFFDVTFYKKGTVHIKFTNRELLDRLNIFCARKKNWLPPFYGKRAYQDMDAEERAVVDSFHGTGENGSGKEAYETICARAGYYLAAAGSGTLLLPNGAA